MLRLLIIALVVVPMVALATVYYRSVNPDGSVTFSDQPSPGAKKMTLPPESTVPDPNATKKSTPAPTPTPTPQAKKPIQEAPVPAKDYYKEFAVQDPADGRTFHNQRKIRVIILVSPGLRERDAIQLYLDGKPYGAPQTNTVFYLNNVDRGEHNLYAKLIGDKGETIKQTGNVTIYIHYASLGAIKRSELINNRTKNNGS